MNRRTARSGFGAVCPRPWSPRCDAAIGLTWIVVSDLFVARLGVGWLDVNLSVAKGIGFVLVTGGLLDVVLRRREQRLTAARQELVQWVVDSSEGRLEQLWVLLIDDDPDDRLLLREADLHQVASGPMILITGTDGRGVTTDGLCT